MFLVLGRPTQGWLLLRSLTFHGVALGCFLFSLRRTMDSEEGADSKSTTSFLLHTLSLKLLALMISVVTFVADSVLGTYRRGNHMEEKENEEQAKQKEGKEKEKMVMMQTEDKFMFIDDDDDDDEEDHFSSSSCSSSPRAPSRRPFLRMSRANSQEPPHDEHEDDDEGKEESDNEFPPPPPPNYLTATYHYSNSSSDNPPPSSPPTSNQPPSPLINNHPASLLCTLPPDPFLTSSPTLPPPLSATTTITTTITSSNSSRFQLQLSHLSKLRRHLRLAVIHAAVSTADSRSTRSSNEEESKNPSNGDVDEEGENAFSRRRRRLMDRRRKEEEERVAKAMVTSLQGLGFDHVYLMKDDVDLGSYLKEMDIHLAWLSSTTDGTGMHTTALLEMLGIPYIGHKPVHRLKLDHAHIFKMELDRLGFNTAPWMTWHPSQGMFEPSNDPRFLAVFQHHLFSSPSPAFVVKPDALREACSFSFSACCSSHYVQGLDDLATAVAQLHQLHGTTVLIEAYLPGQDYTVAVCGPLTYHHAEISSGPLSLIHQSFVRHHEGAFTLLPIERDAIMNESIPPCPSTVVVKRKKVQNNHYYHDHQEEEEEEEEEKEEEDELASQQQELVLLAKQVYHAFHLESLIELEICVDEQGRLYVIQAHSAPCLVPPVSKEGRRQQRSTISGEEEVVVEEEVHSSIASALEREEEKMSYDDLMMSLLIDRLDHFLTYQPHLVPQIVKLLRA